MAPKKEVKQAIAKIAVQSPTGATSETEEVIKQDVYDQPTCNVGFRSGVTKNMGNYNSAKVEVSLFMPCYTEEIDPVFDFIKEWVDKRVQSELEELMNQ